MFVPLGLAPDGVGHVDGDRVDEVPRGACDDTTSEPGAGSADTPPGPPKAGSALADAHARTGIGHDRAGASA